MALDITSYAMGKKAGGSGGTTNYNELSNKPSINNVELSGNKTSDDLGISSTKIEFINTENTSLSPIILEDLEPGIYFYPMYGSGPSGSGVSQQVLYIKAKSNSNLLTIDNPLDSIIFVRKKYTDDLQNGEMIAIVMGANNNPVNGSSFIYKIKKDNTKTELISVTYSFGISRYIKDNQTGTYSGTLTFSNLPKSSKTPTQDDELTRKKYVDDSISNAIGSINTILATLTTPSNNGGV